MDIYIIILGILFLLAISDLVVGVSNDAVNFLNSAIGSRVASFKTIMIIAGIGILVGATFSNGMMEVARKGIFHPQKLYFSEIMILFLAVMLTDIILLDLFNTFGLPTSTTVSIVFELLGASVAIALIKINASAGDASIASYINSAKALAIISGILLSIIISFTAGAIIQLLARTIFSFNYEKTYKYFGALFGSIAVTAITYFLLIKGAKGSSLISDSTLAWIKGNTNIIILYSLAGWFIILQTCILFFKVNIFKFIVLIGTFTLAMAFAGNDLVNFIGVPLAGLASYKSFIAEGANPDLFKMDQLTEAVKTPTYLLLFAGLIMTITLWVSRKARSVTQTEITLGRQEEGEERFNASVLSRIIVRIFYYPGLLIKKILPDSGKKWISKRFENNVNNKDQKASFDLVRASVILFVASIIISFATSLKLPLSTTYVTFMVAMGASLSDRAWGRESAVYRVSGVLTVVGGWFFTAIIAFSVAFLFAIIINWGGIIAIAVIFTLVVFILIKTHLFFNKKEKEKSEFEESLQADEEIGTTQITQGSKKVIEKVPYILNIGIQGLNNEKRKKLKKAKSQSKDLRKELEYIKDNLHVKLQKVEIRNIALGDYYIRALEILKQITNSLSSISRLLFNHVDNHHKPLIKDQQKELISLDEKLKKFSDILINVYNTEFKDLERVNDEKANLLTMIKEFRLKQIERINAKKVSKRNSALYLDILQESEILIDNLYKLYSLDRENIHSVD